MISLLTHRCCHPKAHVHLPPGRWDALEELLTQLDGHLETRADAALVLHEVVHASMGRK